MSRCRIGEVDLRTPISAPIVIRQPVLGIKRPGIMATAAEHTSRIIDERMSDSEPTILRSSANPKVRHLLRMRDNRARRRAGRIIVDGWRETSQAIKAGLVLRGIYLPHDTPTRADEAADGDVQCVLTASSDRLEPHWVSESLMKKISYGQSSRGIVAEFEQPHRDLNDLSLPPNPLILILDQIEKPGNVGAVFRCADAAGVDAVILCENGSDAFNPNAIRASLGAVFRVPSASVNQEHLVEFLINRGIRPLAARVQSSESLWAADLSTPLAIILGNEATGLGDRWARLGQHAIAGIRIPMLGQVDSLNVSASAAVIAFEVARRRQA